MDGNTPGYGQQGPWDANSDLNYLTFVIRQLIGQVRTSLEVQIISCTNGGGVSPFGFVNVQPVVNMQDGIGQTQSHGTVYNLLYFRLQGGTNAIICDPKPGDLGVAFVMDRDTSSAVVNATGLQEGTPGQGNTVPPGSQRRFSLADGFYVGGNLNAAPTSYVRFDDSGNIDVVAPSDLSITVSGGNVIVHGATSYQWDVNGYGQKVTWTGGNNFTIDEYVTGAVITSNTHPIDPPGPP